MSVFRLWPFSGLLLRLALPLVGVIAACAIPAQAAGGWTLSSTIVGAAPPSGTASLPAPATAISASADGSYVAWVSPFSSWGAARFSASGQSLGPASGPGVSASGSGPVEVHFLAATPAGGIVATDSTRNEIFEYDATGRVVQRFGSPGSGAGELTNPQGIAVSPDGSFLVVDSNNDRIQRFSSSGSYVAAYGSTGSLDGQLDGPMGIAVNPDGSFWITDAVNHRIQLWSAAGAHQLTFGAQGSNPGELENPIGISRLSNGDVVVLDATLKRVTRYSSAGALLNVVADTGPGLGDLEEATAMTVLADDTILVSDSARMQLQAYSAAGAFLGARNEVLTGATGLALAIGSFAVHGSSTEVFINKIGSVGNGPTVHRCALEPLSCTQVGVPGVDYGVTIDGASSADGTIVVADVGGPAPARLTASGSLIHNYGAAGSGPGLISASTAVDIASDGTVWFTDISDFELEHFSLSGTYLNTIPTPFSGVFILGFEALADGTFLIHTRSQAQDVLARLSATGAVLWQLSSSQDELQGGAILELGDGTFAFGADALEIRRVSDGSVLSRTEIPVTRFPKFLFGLTRLADGRVLAAESANSRVHIFTQDSLQVAPSVTLPATVGGAFGDQVLRFEVVGAVGALSYVAAWGADSISIGADGLLSTSSLSEGRRLLRVVATEQGSRTAVWEQTITIDRTAPVVSSRQRFATSVNVALDIADATSSPTVTRRGIRAPLLGRNVAHVLVVDTAGNRAVRDVTIIRRPSLVTGSLNRGLELWRPPGQSVFTPGNGPLGAVFAGGSVTRGPYSPALVREVQYRLKQLGRMPRVVRSTGRWDAPTRRAVRSFQRSNALPATGLPDRTTRLALDIALVAL